MTKMTDIKTFIKTASLVILMITVQPLAANNSNTHQTIEELEGVNQNKETTHHSTEEKEKFVPGEFIMHHIGDAYEWHILSYGDFHLSVPLPIIVYSKKSGLHFFMSNKLEHGHSYNGFKIAEHGEFEGKVIELIDGEEVLPLDISITKNVLSLFVSVFLLLLIFFSVAKRYKQNPDSAPKGLQSWMEPLIIFIRDDVAKSSIGEKQYLKFTPFLLTIFFFIFINNLMGLIPIFPFGANLTGNIAVTLILALFTFAITTYKGNKTYWMHIINAPGVPWWLKFPIPLMPIVEIMGVFTKPFVLMIRLFANITAGHIVALGFYSLIFIFGEMNVGLGYGVSVLSITFTIFMSFLELLVAFIQAYVFTLLSALYFGMAMEESH